MLLCTFHMHTLVPYSQTACNCATLCRRFCCGCLKQVATHAYMRTKYKDRCHALQASTRPCHSVLKVHCCEGWTHQMWYALHHLIHMHFTCISEAKVAYLNLKQDHRYAVISKSNVAKGVQHIPCPERGVCRCSTNGPI